MTIVTVVTQYAPVLLAIGAVTTAINQGVQRLPQGPRWARFKNIVNTLTVDYAKCVAELLGAVGIGPRSKP